MPDVTVRPLRPDEVHHVVDYFLDASPEDHARMGVDPSKLPARQAWLRNMERLVAADAASVTSFYSAWIVDGTPVGHAAIKGIVPGASADIHLHMWRGDLRGKGHGARLFCLSALDAYDRFRLRTLLCEPKATNPMPNGMLRRIGFPLLGTRVAASSELSEVTTLNRYRVDRGVAAAYVERSARPLAPS